MSDSTTDNAPSSFARRGPMLLVGAVLAAAVLAATLVGWSTHGTTILFTYAQAGMAWCF